MASSARGLLRPGLAQARQYQNASLFVLSSCQTDATIVNEMFRRASGIDRRDRGVYVLVLGANLRSLWPPITQNVLRLVSFVYGAAQREHMTNVHFMCGNLGAVPSTWKEESAHSIACETIPPISQIVCDPRVCTSSAALRESLAHLFLQPKTLDVSSNDVEFPSISSDVSPTLDDSHVQIYANVCLGGTFDGLHQAHRILLTESVLVATERVLVGLTGDRLLETKKFRELILSGEERREALMDFMQKALLPGKNLKVEVPVLTEPVGPPGWEPNFQCITLSKETEGACGSINAIRKEKGFPLLAAHLINQGQLLPDPEANADHAENKQMSSTNLRTRKLGELLRVPDPDRQPFLPNLTVVGLTGGSCSGKSSVCRWLQEDHGAYIVDCDQLGHAAYNEPGSSCWKELVQAFGHSIINAKDRSIDRTALGKVVFSDPQVKLAQLNQIVWPHIGDMAKSRLTSYAATSGSQNRKIAILDAAVLLEAGWQHMCDEIWVVFVPRELQIQRIVERDSKTWEEAEKRLDAQMSNDDRIREANVVLTTVFERSINRDMVNKAVGLLNQRIAKRKSDLSKL